MGAATGAGRDRLAVWDWEGQGERVATGDWLVTDAERAAAGRETVTARFLALLPANRERAARRYADGGLPDGEELVRVWCPRDPAALEARLAGKDLAAWPEGDVLHVLWRGAASRASLASGIQLPLWPVDGAAGLWEASVRVRRLDEAAITLAVAVIDDNGPMLGRSPGDPLVFRGPGAPAPAIAEPLAGQVQEHLIESAALGAPPKTDLRSLEYLPPRRSRRFAAHLSFVTGEVIPWAAGRYPVARQPWTTAGFSNGAAWAIAAAQRRPDVFGRVAALSAGVVPHRVTRGSRLVRHYLAAGTLEPGFRRSTAQWATRLDRAGMAYAHQEWAGGHDNWWWHQQLPVALAWLLAAG